MGRLWLCFLLLIAAPGFAQDKKISALPDGSPGQTTDVLPIARAGTNYKLPFSAFASPAGPLLLTNGTVAAPSLSFASETGLGLYRYTAGYIGMAYSGSVVQIWSNTGFILRDYGGIYWSTNPGVTLADLTLVRDAAAALQVGPDAATAIAQTFKGPDSTGATIAGASLTIKGGAGTSGIANGGALILAGGANSSTGEPGAVAISDGGTKPTCAAGIRGSIWYDAGAAGVADTFEVCRKDAANNYAWATLY